MNKNLREIEREIVSALVYSADGKLLMGQKDPNKGGVYSDCWHIPGGGTDDEDLITALKREVLEETGIDISDSKIELIDDQGRGQSEKILKDTGEKVLCNMKFNVYRVDLNEDSVDLNLDPTDDLVILRWFDAAELPGVKLTPPSTSLFQRLKLIN